LQASHQVPPHVVLATHFVPVLLDRAGREVSPFSLEAHPDLRKLWLTLGIPSGSFARDLQFIGQLLTPRRQVECFRALESLVIMVGCAAWHGSLEDVHSRSFERLGHQLSTNGRACYPLLREMIVCFTRPMGDDFPHRYDSKSVVWSTFEPPDVWDSAIRNSLTSIEALGVEVKVKWMGCNKLVWYSWMKGCGI
jgi:hypothetical protein